ncbi:hypothetical protein V1519DRAFT_448914, partial [Lipomyces tetrasporus]
MIIKICQYMRVDLVTMIILSFLCLCSRQSEKSGLTYDVCLISHSQVFRSVSRIIWPTSSISTPYAKQRESVYGWPRELTTEGPWEAHNDVCIQWLGD